MQNQSSAHESTFDTQLIISGESSWKIFKLLTCFLEFYFYHLQVWGVKYNATGSKIVSVSDDKSIIVYNCPL